MGRPNTWRGSVSLGFSPSDVEPCQANCSSTAVSHTEHPLHALITLLADLEIVAMPPSPPSLCSLGASEKSGGTGVVL